MTVAELLKALKKLPPELEVKVWLPGSRIRLSDCRRSLAERCVLIEGNLELGSALAEAWQPSDRQSDVVCMKCLWQGARQFSGLWRPCPKCGQAAVVLGTTAEAKRYLGRE